MKVMFNVQDLSEYVVERFQPLVENVTCAHKVAYKESKKKDQNVLFYIHQCVEAKVFDKIIHAATSKEAWNMLKRYHGGDAKVKKVRLQSFKKQYEMLHMKEGETISDFFIRVQELTNQMKNYGETLTEQMNVEKVFRSLTPQYDMIIVTIEKIKDLETMKMEDLQGSLEVRKLRLNQRETNKDFEQALIAHSRKESSDDMKRRWKQRKGKHQREVTPDRKEKKKFEERSESSKGGGGSSKFQNKKNFQDKRRIQCFNCEKYGYFASNCWFEKGKKKIVAEKANMVQDDLDSDHVMLMIITSEGVPASDVWYLDSGCPNHMTGHKGWLTDFNSNKKTNVKLTDSRSFMAEGMSKIIVQRKEDKTTLIKDVLVVPLCNVIC